MSKKYTRKNKKRKIKRGGDIESGHIENIIPIKNIPPDPERFKKYDDQIKTELLKPISAKEATAFFEGPTPEKKNIIERKLMFDEDPLNKEPFEREELTIFRGGKTKRTKKYKKKHHKRKSTRRIKRR
jgi:hypothetical protein